MSLEDRSGRIDKSRLEHLWSQVAGDLRSDIESGKLRPGAKLPSEPELAAQYGVARVTVRRAIAELISEGRLVILHGRGTFVRERS